jgi:oxygen-dependent protoporphyrinogen oxidase
VEPWWPDTARALATIPVADVAMVTLAVSAADWPDRLRALSGYLVPKPVQRLVTAVSFGSQKWAHWASDDKILLRISLGRDGLPVLHLGDDQLLATAVDEVGSHLGLDLAPTASRVTRWAGAFPQYRPHHAQKVAAIEAGLPHGLALAGASYHGIGVPACINSAGKAAARLAQ